MLFLFCLQKEDFMHKILPQEKAKCVVVETCKDYSVLH